MLREHNCNHIVREIFKSKIYSSFSVLDQLFHPHQCYLRFVSEDHGESWRRHLQYFERKVTVIDGFCLVGYI